MAWLITLGPDGTKFGEEEDVLTYIPVNLRNLEAVLEL